MLFGIPSQSARKTFITCLVLYLFAQVLFLINIQFPRTPNFDEFHYVPSAKQFLAWTDNQNWEHPPLGKMIMAMGIAIGGDRPFGWRLMSTVFGALTLVGMFVWANALFRNERLAIWAALLTLFNQLLYVQARIGMLDTFMFAFLAWGCAAFTASWTTEISSDRVRRNLVFAGVMFGLAMGTKWFALAAWLSCVLLIIAVRLLQRWQMSFARASADDWYSPRLWEGVSAKDWVPRFVLLPLGVYFLVCVPLLFTQKALNQGIWDLFLMQKTMYEGQLRVVSDHPYMSHWSDWPTLRRPIWYAFDKEAGIEKEQVRAVILLGNPLIMWAGLVAIVYCAWAWITERSRQAFLIVAFYAIFYGCWVVIPRKVSFYYYYYPAGMVLSFALAYFFHKLEAASPKKNWRMFFLTASLGVFVYFYPILAALRINSDSFRRWMWLWSWI